MLFREKSKEYCSDRNSEKISYSRFLTLMHHFFISQYVLSRLEITLCLFHVEIDVDNDEVKRIFS